MAKEEHIEQPHDTKSSCSNFSVRKLELKVSVNCCDGCKKKVKKVLQSTEGVLKAEINPSQPKVTVLGNVDPQILIRKLSKAGKQAELWRHQNENEKREKKEAEWPETKEKVTTKAECKQATSGESYSVTNIKSKECKSKDEFRDKASNQDQKKKDNTEVIKKEKPLLQNPETNSTVYYEKMHDMGNVKSSTQHCYVVEPHMISVPCHVLPSFAAPLPLTCYGSQHYYYVNPAPQTSFQTPTTRVGDYFSDENTMGCYVM